METTIVGEIGYGGFDCYGLYNGYMAGCHNYGPKTLNIRCRIIIGIQTKDHNFVNHAYRWYVGLA